MKTAIRLKGVIIAAIFLSLATCTAGSADKAGNAGKTPVKGSAMITSVKAELPRLRHPITFIVDDSAPGINPLYCERRYADRRRPGRLFKLWELHEARMPAGTKMVREIPLSFLREYAKWVSENNVRGKFTVLPFPGGQGSILKGWKGCSKKEIDQWLAIVRKKIVPICDITPEIFTHAQPVDLKTGKLLAGHEDRYTSKLNVKDLTAYYSGALKMLKKVGLKPVGITQPRGYYGDEKKVLVPAVLAAMKKTCGVKLSYYFLKLDPKMSRVFPKIMHLDRKKAEAVVSIIAGCGESAWRCIAGGGDVSKMADYYITADGKRGKFVKWVKNGGCLIFYSHWQSLYGNGTKKGLVTFRRVVKRANKHLGDKLLWMKTGELARYHVAMQTFESEVEQKGAKARITLTCPFDCRDFTVGFDLDVKKKTLRITAAKKTIMRVNSRKLLKENTWVREGERVYVCLPLKAKAKTVLEVSAR